MLFWFFQLDNVGLAQLRITVIGDYKNKGFLHIHHKNSPNRESVTNAQVIVPIMACKSVTV